MINQNKVKRRWRSVPAGSAWAAGQVAIATALAIEIWDPTGNEFVLDSPFDRAAPASPRRR